MIELKRLKLINWHNFENVTFDCARLTYMIGVNAVGKTTILDAIRYCLTTNRNFNALGNKKSGRTLQGSVHAKQRGEHHQHCRHHQGNGERAPHPAANEPGDQRVEDDSEKQRQQQLHQNIGGGVDPGEDNHQRRQLK